MDSILKSLSVGLLLRWFIAGIFGVISFRLARGEIGSADALLRFEHHYLGLALLGGATTYGIHRSTLYPWIEWFLDSQLASRWRMSCPLISRRSREALRIRWDRAADKDLPCSGIVKHTSGWADWAHMQYSSTWCIAAGAIGAGATSPAKLEICGPLLTIALLLAVSAFVSDWRLHSVEDYLSKLNSRE